MSCSICTETMNKSTRKPIKCNFCEYIACLDCTKRYLLNTVHQPHCMNCRKEWSWDILVESFPSTFLKEEYRSMRETILLEEEKIYLPELLSKAEHIKKLDVLNKEFNQITTKIFENDIKEDQLVSTQRKMDRELKEEREAVRTKMSNLHKKSFKERVEFRVSMKCPSEDCRGFLSESFQCGLCTKDFCKECHETKNQEHKCNPDQVETVKELEKSTKPCPKCMIRIYKTDGCDQMFCTQCRTAFSWRTGRVEEGVIHNPHYYQMMRAGQITDERHRPADCEQMPAFQQINRLIHKKSREIQDFLYLMHQRLTHHRNVTLVEMNQPVNYEKERLSYLVGEVDERKFKQKLYVRWQRNLRIREERQIISTFLVVGEQLMKQLTLENIEQTVKQFEKVKEINIQAVLELDKRFQHKGLISSYSFAIHI